MYRSVKEGAPITLDEVNTIADGIAVKHPGTLTYELTKSTWTTYLPFPRTK